MRGGGGERTVNQVCKLHSIERKVQKAQLLYNKIYFLFQSEYNGERTVEGIAKFIETDGVFGMAAPDHDEL